MKKDRFRLFDFDATGNWGKLKARVLEILVVNLKQRECPPPSNCSKHSGLGITCYTQFAQMSWCWWDRGFFEKLFFVVKKSPKPSSRLFFLYSTKCWGTKMIQLGPTSNCEGVTSPSVIVKNGMFGNRLSKHGLIIYPGWMMDAHVLSFFFFFCVRKRCWNNEQNV